MLLVPFSPYQGESPRGFLGKGTWRVQPSYHPYSVHICSSSNYTNHTVASSSRRKGPTTKITLHTTILLASTYFTNILIRRLDYSTQELRVIWCGGVRRRYIYAHPYIHYFICCATPTMRIVRQIHSGRFKAKECHERPFILWHRVQSNTVYSSSISIYP